MSVRLKTVLLALALLVATADLFSQTRATGAIAGLVTDSSGAVVRHASVRVENTNTGAVAETQSDETGRFSIAGLAISGSYDIRIAAPGFADVIRTGVRLRSDDAVRLAVEMNVNARADSVYVNGGLQGVRVESAELGSTLTSERIEGLPIAGRKMSNLPLIDSSVRPARGTGDLFVGSTLFVVNGNGRRQTTFSVDNATADDAWGRQTAFTAVPLSAVQEFSIVANALSAEYGRTTGAAINVVTKSGTNQWHGQGISLWRPGALQARAPLATVDTEDRLWQGSAAVGGPVVRDKTHAFLAVEHNHCKRASLSTEGERLATSLTCAE